MEELIGKNDYDFFPKDEADFFTAKDRAVLESGEMVDIPEEPMATPTRGVRYLHTKKIPIRDSTGRPRYLVGISEDITDRKRADEQLREQNVRLQELARAEREANDALAAFFGRDDVGINQSPGLAVVEAGQVGRDEVLLSETN